MSLTTPLLCQHLLSLVTETARIGTMAPGTSHRHKTILEGIHNLADLLLEEGRNLGVEDHRVSEIRLICDLAKEGIVGGRPMDESFHYILDAAERAEIRCQPDSEGLLG